MNREDLRLAIRQRADMVGSLFVTDDEIDAMIDSSVGDLYDILAQQFGDEYWSTITWLQVNGTGDPSIAWPCLQLTQNGFVVDTGPDNGIGTLFPLPADFTRLTRVQFFKGTITRQNVNVGISQLSSQLSEVQPAPNWQLTAPDKTAYPIHRIDTAGQIFDYTPKDWLQTHVAYRLRHSATAQLRMSTVGTQGVIYQSLPVIDTWIEFLPVPTGQYAVQIEYVPKAQLIPNHPFPEYIIFDCAALCLEKQRSDSSTLRALQDRVKARISQSARTVDAANAPMVGDVYGRNRLPGSRGGWPW